MPLLKPLIVRGMDRYWRLDSEGDLDLGLVCRNPQGLEGNLDFVVSVCCKRMRSTAENRFAVVEGKVVDRQLDEGDTEAAVAAGQAHCFVLNSDNTRSR